jgi:hypothetical protein
MSGSDGERYLAWSNESNQPLCDHGYEAGCRPTSPGEDACTSPINGSVPYRCVYQAIEPVARSVADARVAREYTSDYGMVYRTYATAFS